MQPQIVRYFPFQDCLPEKKYLFKELINFIAIAQSILWPGCQAVLNSGVVEDTGAYQIAKVTYYGRRWLILILLVSI